MSTYIGKSSTGSLLITQGHRSLLSAAREMERRLPPGQWLDGIRPLPGTEPVFAPELPAARRAG